MFKKTLSIAVLALISTSAARHNRHLARNYVQFIDGDYEDNF